MNLSRAALVILACSAFACSKTSTSTSTSTASSTSPPTSTPTTNAAAISGDALKPGDPAPDFTAKSQDGKDVKLSSFKGHPVLVYFYPKDETPGCTKEACSFRDAWNDLDKKGVVLIGISADSDASHKAFAEHHKLPFTLVSDPEGKIAAQFGVPFHLGTTARQTFVINADGTIKKIYRQVDVSTHAKDVMGDLS